MDTDHIVKEYDEELKKLDHLVAEMGGLVESQLAASIDALVKFDLDKANTIIKADKKIDQLEIEIDEFAIKLIALRQPMADDLRAIITSLKISNNLERIGDYAKNIAKRSITLSKTTILPGPSGVIRSMSDIVQSMIRNVLDAYVARDAGRADDVRLRDEQVDQLHSGIFRELLTYMMENPRNITTCTHLLFIAKNIERMGDHTTNIAEYVRFMVTGKMPEDERPKDDQTASLVAPESDK